jgi:hypothetical protein
MSQILYFFQDGREKLKRRKPHWRRQRQGVFTMALLGMQALYCLRRESSAGFSFKIGTTKRTLPTSWSFHPITFLQLSD